MINRLKMLNIILHVNYAMLFVAKYLKIEHIINVKNKFNVQKAEKRDTQWLMKKYV